MFGSLKSVDAFMIGGGLVILGASLASSPTDTHKLTWSSVFFILSYVFFGFGLIVLAFATLRLIWRTGKTAIVSYRKRNP